MLCERCKTEHNSSYGTGRFCSKKCASSRSWTAEDKQKKSAAMKAFSETTEGIAHRQMKRNVDYAKVSKSLKERSNRRTFEECGWDSKRDRIITEQNYKCIKCGISEWLGVPVSFEIDHKDGINTNDSRENLEALCPNCHSQTTTWRGRNKK
jgi:5-methylcytosine-specific restriction endonuclease McrA